MCIEIMLYYYYMQNINALYHTQVYKIYFSWSHIWLHSYITCKM